MKNSVSNVLTAPFKLAKALMEMMRSVLSSILKMFGLKGLAPAHSAEAPAPENALTSEEMAADKGQNNDMKPGIELARKMIPDPLLDKIQAFAKASGENRKKIDLSGVSPSMKAVLATMTPTQLKALGEMERENARYIMFNGLKQMMVREKQLEKQNTALNGLHPSPVEKAAMEARAGKKYEISEERLKDRINKRKQSKAPSSSLAFGM